MLGSAGNPSISLPCFRIASNHFPCRRDLFIYLRGKLIVFAQQEGRATTTGRQWLFISYGRPRDDSERRPAPSRIPGLSTTENCLRSRIVRDVSHRNGEAQDGRREHCRQTTRGETCLLCWYLVMVANLLSSSAALATGVKTTISAFPALKAKGENLPLRADHNLYFLDANHTGTAERIRQRWRNAQGNVVASSLRPYQRSKY